MYMAFCKSCGNEVNDGKLAYISITNNPDIDMPANSNGYWTYKRSGMNNQDKKYFFQSLETEKNYYLLWNTC